MKLREIFLHRKIINHSAVQLLIFGICSFLFALNSIVDTCNFESKSMNMFESYWFVFDDNKTGVDYNGVYIDSTGEFQDSLTGGNSSVKNFIKVSPDEYEEFTFTANGNTDTSGTQSYCAMMAFQFGDIYPKWGPSVDNVYGCYVGMGTGLISDGNQLNLTGTSRITYWARASDTIMCNFLVATDQGRFKEFGTMYQIEHTILPGWNQYFVYPREKSTDTNIVDSMYLYQPAWAITEKPLHPADGGVCLSILPLNIQRATLLEWELGGAGELAHVNLAWDKKAGTLWVDDIVIENYTWYPEDVCMECDTITGIGATLPVNPILLTDGGHYNMLDKGAWYAYNDAKNRVVSIPIVEYSWIDTITADYGPPDSTLPMLKLLDATGITAVTGDTAAYISYVLGPSYRLVSSTDSTDTNDVKPFVGIGLSLCNEDDPADHFPMDSLGVKGIYFEYKTTGALKWLQVAVLTRQVFIEEGARFYVKVPPSNGQWRGAIVPFENIDLPPWDDKDTVSFDSSTTIALQWSVEGDSGDVGSFSIDNVYLLDTAHVGIKYLTLSTKGGGFSLKQINNRLVYTLPQGTKNAIVSLYNLQGRAIYSQRVKTLNNAGSYSLPLKTNTIANGVYIFRVRTLGKNKKVFNKAITLVK